MSASTIGRVHGAIGCTPTALLYGIHGISGDNLLSISNFEGTTFEYLKIHQEHQLKLLKLSEDHQAKELMSIARSQGISKPRKSRRRICAAEIK